MTIATLHSTQPSPQLVRLTVEQYELMLTQGILQEGAPIELLDGLLVLKDRSKAGEDAMTIGTHHVWAIKKLEKLGARVWAHGCHMCTQAPIVILPSNMPEPDGTLVRGNEDLYLKHHPAPQDVLCAFEVSDTSLSDDRTTKQRIYANTGIPQYVIVNLVDHVVEVRRNPVVGEGQYADTQTVQPGQTFSIPLADGTSLDVAASELLP